MISDLFYTLFKYKEKAQKDELGYYPEKVHVRAFPERRFLWTSRFLVVISCLSICVSMILSSILSILLPMKRTGVVPLRIDYNRYQVTRIYPSEVRVYAGDLVVESLIAKYITIRYTIDDDYDKYRNRLSPGSFFDAVTSEDTLHYFEFTEKPYFDLLQRKGVRREIKINSIYPVSYDFWQVRFTTIDTAPDLPVEEFMELMKVNTASAINPPKQGDPLITKWIATIRMKFNIHKDDDRDRALINPFGMSITSYDLSYMGNTIKTQRN